MMSDFATNVEAVLLSLGWTEVATDIEKMTIRAIFSAPGAAEQELVLKAGGYKKALAEFGGPELYPATVEYDVESRETSVVDYQEFRAKMVEADPALEQTIQEERELNRAEEIAAQYPGITQAVLKTVVAECSQELAEKEEVVMVKSETAHLERVEGESYQPDGDEPVNNVPAGNPANRGLLEQALHDVAPFLPHDVELAAAAIRDVEDAVSALGQPIVPMSFLNTVAAPEQVPSVQHDDEEGIMSRNDLVLMLVPDLHKTAARLGLKGHSKLNKVVLIEAIAHILDLPSTLPIPDAEREDVAGQMSVANAEMIDRPAPNPIDELPNLEEYTDISVLLSKKVRIGRTAHLVRTRDSGSVFIDGCVLEIKGVVGDKELHCSYPGLVIAKWLHSIFKVRAVYSR